MNPLSFLDSRRSLSPFIPVETGTRMTDGGNIVIGFCENWHDH